IRFNLNVASDFPSSAALANRSPEESKVPVNVDEDARSIAPVRLARRCAVIECERQNQAPQAERIDPVDWVVVRKSVAVQAARFGDRIAIQPANARVLKAERIADEP